MTAPSTTSLSDLLHAVAELLDASPDLPDGGLREAIGRCRDERPYNAIIARVPRPQILDAPPERTP